MGVDASVMEGREVEYEALLSDFGWDRNFLQGRKIEAFKSDVRKEIGRLEAGSWMSHAGQRDDRVSAFERLLDKTIAECDELEGLLTLYSVELNVSATGGERLFYTLT